MRGGERSSPVLVGLAVAAMAAQGWLAAVFVGHWDAIPGIGGTAGRLLAGFAAAEHGFYDRPGQAELGLAAVNLVAGCGLALALAWAWLRRAAAALPLALALAATQCYAVVILMWCGLLDGLPNLERSMAAASLLLAVGGGWFALFLLLGWEAAARLWRAGRLGAPDGGRGSDRAVLVLTLCFVVAAFLVELPWLLGSTELATIGGRFGAFWAVYGAADRGYFDRVSGFERGLESFHIFVTQWLQIWLIWAVLRRRPQRFLLMVAVGSYVAFSTAVYLAAKHVMGYPLMPERTAGAMLLLYGANLPWLVGNAWIAWEGGRGLVAMMGTRRRDEREGTA
jgi:hypothetical protein